MDTDEEGTNGWNRMFLLHLCQYLASPWLGITDWRGGGIAIYLSRNINYRIVFTASEFGKYKSVFIEIFNTEC